MSELQTLEYALCDGVAEIRFNRPEAANGIDLALGEELLALTIALQQDSRVRAVLLTGNGKMFCAGGDLRAFASFGEELGAKLKLLTVNMHAAIANLCRMDAPVVVAVNGTAAGAGFSIAVTGDIVLAAESAKFTMAYTAAGLSPDGGSSYFLPRLIGLRRTQELMLTNRRLSAAEALDWGLVTRVVADEQLLDEARALARQLASGPTRAFAASKRLLAETFTSGLETQLERESSAIVAMTGTADGKEGIQAFLEKRKPSFTGE